MSDLERARDRPEEAMRLARQAHDVVRDAAVHTLMTRSHLTLADSHRALGQLRQALDAGQEALRPARANGTTYTQTSVLIGLVRTHLELGDAEQAPAHAARAERPAREVGCHRLERLAVFPPGSPGKTRR